MSPHATQLQVCFRALAHPSPTSPYTDSHASCSLGGSYLSSHFASRLRLSFPASIMSSVRLSLGSSLLGFVSPWVCLSLLVRALCPRPLQPYTAAIHICSHVAGLLSRLLLGVKGCQRAFCYSIMILAPSGSFKHTCSRNTCGSMAIIDSHGSVHAGQHGLATLVGMEGSS